MTAARLGMRRCAQSPAPEVRQNLAHSVSCGFASYLEMSSGGAAETSLPLLRSFFIPSANPGLTPGATIFRCSAAWLQPEGLTEGSRGSSAATPPVKRRHENAPRRGARWAASGGLASLRDAGSLGGSPGVSSRSALLNPRLPSVNPLGCSEPVTRVLRACRSAKMAVAESDSSAILLTMNANIQTEMIQLADGSRVLRLSKPASGLSLEKKLDAARPVVRQKDWLMKEFAALLVCGASFESA